MAGRRRGAGLAWLAAGLGYAAIVLERETNDDLRRYRDLRWAAQDRSQWAAHAALGVLGYRWLTSRG